MIDHSKVILATAFCIALAGGASSAYGGVQGAAEASDGGTVQLVRSVAPLNMETTVVTAVLWHPSVRNAAGYLFEADDYIQAARADYFPQIRAGITSEYGNRNLPGYNSRRAHRVTVSASQMLYDFGKVSSAVDRTEALRAAAEARVLLAVDDLSRDTAQAWIEVRRYEELRSIAHEQKRSVMAIADLVRDRHAQGASPRSDEMQAQAREESAHALELEVRAQLERWRTQLQHLSGLKAIPETGGDIPAGMQHACVVRGATLVPPAIKVAEAEARAAQADIDHATSQARPTLSLDGSIGRGLDAESRVGRSQDASVMLNVSAPLYRGGGNRARRRAAGHALGAAQAALEYARLANSQLLEDARAQAAGNARRTGVLQDRVASLAETRMLYGQQYLDLGTRSLLELLNAEQEYQQSRLEQTNNKHDLFRQQIDCLYGTGRLREMFELDGLQVAGVELVP